MKIGQEPWRIMLKCGYKRRIKKFVEVIEYVAQSSKERRSSHD